MTFPSSALWLKAFARFTGRVHQRIANDIVEHGEPHAERAYSLTDVHDRLAEIGQLAFELSEMCENLLPEGPPRLANRRYNHPKECINCGVTELTGTGSCLGCGNPRDMREGE